MSTKDTSVDEQTIQLAKSQLPTWLLNANNYPLETYNIATLILHQGKEGCFAIINWWIDENMLQNFVYLIEEGQDYKLFSANGITTCVWEMAILWHERNAWVKHILMKNENPDFKAYLNEQFNENV